VDLLAFYESRRFDTSALFLGDKARLALFPERKQKYQNGSIERVATSEREYFCDNCSGLGHLFA
jgi:hypothetical protein